jgi:hypothetical protein
MSPEQAGNLSAEVRHSFRIPAVLAITAIVGVVVGAVAQLLTSASGAVSALGASTAIWVTIGFVLVAGVAKRWSGRDRLPWTCVVMAAYLYGWLLAYHAMYGLIKGPPVMTVWGESRLWVAAVAPACVGLGCLAVGSLRSGVAGDMCLAAPLAWSLPEAVRMISGGWSHGLLLAVPTLLVAAIPLAATRRRRWSPTVVTMTALLGGAALMVVIPLATRVLNSAG